MVPHRQAEERAGLHGNLVSDTEIIFFFFLPFHFICTKTLTTMLLYNMFIECKFFGKLVTYFIALRLAHVYWGDKAPKTIQN